MPINVQWLMPLRDWAQIFNNVINGFIMNKLLYIYVCGSGRRHALAEVTIIRGANHWG